MLTRPAFDASGRYPSLFLTEENLLLDSIANDFPEIVTLASAGDSYEKRPMRYAVVDARKYLVSKHVSSQNATLIQTLGLHLTSADEEMKSHFHEQPAILLTGEIHARESITGPLVLYSML